MRTSNNYNDDDVTLFWQSNFGFFDTRRSFTVSQVFLFDFQDLSYDLTVVPVAPDEPWQGSIEAIRLDPVVRFLDILGDPADGWFEIDSVSIY